MERKLVKQGRNALTITLPAEWIKSKGLTEKDYVYLTQVKDTLIVSSDNVKDKIDVSIDIIDKQESYCWHLSLGKYIQGYDIIDIKHNNRKFIYELIIRLPGFILENCSDSNARLVDVSKTPENNFKMILRRATHMLKEQAKLLKEGKLVEMIQQERMLDMNLRYCMRFINKYYRENDAQQMFLLCSTMEFLGDQLNVIAKHIDKNRKNAEEIYDLIDVYIESIFTGKFLLTYEKIRNFRDKLEKVTYLDALCFNLAEILYDNIGYLVNK